MTLKLNLSPNVPADTRTFWLAWLLPALFTSKRSKRHYSQKVRSERSGAVSLAC